MPASSELSIWPDDKRAEMGKLIAEMVQSGKDARDNARGDRWARAKAMYQNEPVGAASVEDGGEADGSTFNLVQVKVDGLIAHVVAPLTSQEPYCFANHYGEEGVSDVIERACQFFAKRSNLQMHLADVALPTAQFGRAFLRAEYKEYDDEAKKYPCVKLTVVEPWDMVVYPPKAPCLTEAKLFGWRFQRRREEIEALQEEGRYLKDPISGGGVGEESVAGYDEIAPGGQPIQDDVIRRPDDVIDLYTVVFDHYEGGKKKRLWATIEPDSQVLLWVREYPWKRSLNVFEFRFKTVSKRDGYWPSNSVVQDLQSHQLDVNQAMSLAMDGLRANALGFHFGPSVELQPKFATVKPGELGLWPGADAINSHFPRVDTSAVPAVLSMLVSNADNVVRLSQVGTGGESPKGQTATATQFAAAGQAAGKDDYARRFGEGVVAFFEWLCEALEMNFSDWHPHLGAAIGEDGEELTPDMFARPYDWELSIASTNQHPGTQMNSAMMLLETAAQVPEGKIKKYELVKRILQLAERTGFTNAEGLQEEQDPIEVAAQALLDLGIEPGIVEQLLAAVTSGLGQAPVQPGMGRDPGVSGASAYGMSPGDGSMQPGQAPPFTGAVGTPSGIPESGNF